MTPTPIVAGVEVPAVSVPMGVKFLRSLQLVRITNCHSFNKLENMYLCFGSEYDVDYDMSSSCFFLSFFSVAALCIAITLVMPPPNTPLQSA